MNELLKETKYTELQLESLEDLVANYREEYDSMDDKECLYYVKKMALFKLLLMEELEKNNITKELYEEIYNEINIKNPIIK